MVGFDSPTGYDLLHETKTKKLKRSSARSQMCICWISTQSAGLLPGEETIQVLQRRNLTVGHRERTALVRYPPAKIHISSLRGPRELPTSGIFSVSAAPVKKRGR